jgi:hypothetical protein
MQRGRFYLATSLPKGIGNRERACNCIVGARSHVCKCRLQRAHSQCGLVRSVREEPSRRTGIIIPSSVSSLCGTFSIFSPCLRAYLQHPISRAGSSFAGPVTRPLLLRLSSATRTAVSFSIFEPPLCSGGAGTVLHPLRIKGRSIALLPKTFR